MIPAQRLTPNNAINADSQKRRFAPLLLAGYGERWATSICPDFDRST